MSGGSWVRAAHPSDRDAVLAVVHAAFGVNGGDASQELQIVRAIWDRGTADVELVAGMHETVVGYVASSVGRLNGHPVPGVAPLAVVPGRQGGGVGTALMTELVNRVDRAGLPILVLLGAPAYYARFGFEAAAPLGIWYRPAGKDNPHVQVRRLTAYSPELRGEYRYSWELPPQL